jgi:hypothetical protein
VTQEAFLSELATLLLDELAPLNFLLEKVRRQREAT